MSEKAKFFTFPNNPRITVDPRICTGKPHIEGTRITISAILANLAGGMTVENMLAEFPRLQKEDIYQALAFASLQLQDQYLPIAIVS